MTSHRQLAVATVAFTALIALGACGSKKSTSSSSATTTAAAPTTTAAATTSAAATTAAATTTTTAAAKTTAAATTTVAATTTSAAAAVSSAEPKPCAADAAPAAVALEANEFTFTGPATAKGGAVAFDVKNVGKAMHELAVIKADSYASLPVDEYGAVDETKLAAGALVGRTAKFAGGSACGATFNLTPGKYVLVCNIEFKGAQVISHAGKGMHVDFDVTA